LKDPIISLLEDGDTLITIISQWDHLSNDAFMITRIEDDYYVIFDRTDGILKTSLSENANKEFTKIEYRIKKIIIRGEDCFSIMFSFDFFVKNKRYHDDSFSCEILNFNEL
jgi:hypothetical protein